MASHAQHTLANPVCFQGVGIHTGTLTRVRLSPAEPHCGIRFRRTDVTDRDADIRASVEAVCQTRLGTVIGNADGVSVSTVEHLMAAFCGLGIDNVIVEIDGPEVPIMDGSCEPLVAAIDKAGRRTQAARRRFIEVLEPIIVTDGDKSASLSPSAGFQLAFDIAFETSAIGRQHLEISVDEQTFRRDLAAARTFGFLHEVEALRAAGLARGGSLETVVVIDGDQILNPGGLRHFDEFVRHKALDAMGDLYLLGAPLIGRYDGVYSGHALNNRLAHALIARPEAWRFAMPRQSFAQAV